MKFDVLDINGVKVDTVELSDAVFGITPNEKVMHMAVVNFLANQRQGTQSTLTRAEVSGGGRKPWRQKGTGRARQGSIRAPQWTHGGIAFGPKPRHFENSMNKKARQLAIKSALAAKFQAGNMIVVENIEMNEIKTKSFIGFLNNINANCKALVITPEVRKNVVLSARNIPNVTTTISSIISTYEILKAEKLVVDKVAVEKIQEVYA